MNGDLCLACLKRVALSEEELRLYKTGKLTIEYGEKGICPECIKLKKLVSGYSYNQSDILRKEN